MQLAGCFIQKVSHSVQPLSCGSAGWCGFLKRLLAASPQLAQKTTGQCFVTFLQGKHKRLGTDYWRRQVGHLSRAYGV